MRDVALECDVNVALQPPQPPPTIIRTLNAVSHTARSLEYTSQVTLRAVVLPAGTHTRCSALASSTWRVSRHLRAARPAAVHHVLAAVQAEGQPEERAAHPAQPEARLDGQRLWQSGGGEGEGNQSLASEPVRHTSRCHDASHSPKPPVAGQPLESLKLTSQAQQPDSRVTRVGPDEKQAGQVIGRGAAQLLRVSRGSPSLGTCR
jgi:hypothetical protein